MNMGRHIVPPLRLFHGDNSLDRLADELQRLGCRRAVVLCGASMAQEGAGLAEVRRAAGDRCAGVLAGVRAHSPLDAVQHSARELLRLGADAVIALGGGSAIVTARAASILLAEAGDAHAMCTRRDDQGVLLSPKLMAPKLPQLVVPTTPTTATLKAGSAVLDPATGKRLALFDPKTRAKAVFVTPALLKTPPPELVVSAGLNTLAMALEGLMSLSGDPFSDGMLIHATRLLARGLPEAVKAADAEVRQDLMFASLICGHGTDYTGAGIAIPLGHAISAMFHVDNGITNAIVLPHVLRFNADAARSGLRKVGTALGREAQAGAAASRIAGSVVEALQALFEAMRVPARLRDIGVTRESLPRLAAISMDDWFVRDNPRPITHADQLQQVLEAAW